MKEEQNKIADLRRDYQSSTLSIDELANDPIIQFQKWLDEAIVAKVLEPNAMTLATVGADGSPSARVVLLKGLKEDGFVFYTNYQSGKSKHLATNPKAALVFCWLALERQVRIEGTVVLASVDTSDDYYQSRPKGSRLGAWVSPQSEPINSRDVLSNKEKDVNALFEEVESIPRPPFWGGYVLLPNKIEFWQGRSSRLHDRIIYERNKDQWSRYRVAP